MATYELTIANAGHILKSVFFNNYITGIIPEADVIGSETFTEYRKKNKRTDKFEGKIVALNIRGEAPQGKFINEMLLVNNPLYGQNTTPYCGVITYGSGNIRYDYYIWFCFNFSMDGSSKLFTCDIISESDMRIRNLERKIILA